MRNGHEALISESQNAIIVIIMKGLNRKYPRVWFNYIKFQSIFNIKPYYIMITWNWYRIISYRHLGFFQWNSKNYDEQYRAM